MRRLLSIVVLGLLAILVLTAGLALYLVHDEAFLKARIGALVEEHTGRSLRIDGPLNVSLGRVVHIDVRDVRFANAAWAATPDMLRLGRARVGIDIPSLFSGDPLLTEVSLERCAIELERHSSGEANWAVVPASESAPETETGGFLPARIGRSRIEDCGLRLRAPDGETTLDVRIEAADIGIRDDDRIAADVAGSLNGRPLEIDGWLAPVGVFARGGSLQYELQARAGPVTLDSSGAIADLRRLAGLDLSTRFSGPEIAILLHEFQQPPISEGSFDFRVDLATRNDMTLIDVDGDLGSLDIVANGTIDQLVRPENGQFELQVAGPDLEALGAAFGVAGLVREPYTARVSATVRDGAFTIHEAEIGTAGDLLDIAGMLALRSGLKDSELRLDLDSEEVSRWADLLHRGPGPAGKVTLEGRLSTDAAGLLMLDAQLQQDDRLLRVNGRLGTIDRIPDAALDIAFSAPSPGPLMRWLADWPLPERPLEVTGQLFATAEALRLGDVRAASGPHVLRVDGTFGLNAEMSGTALDLEFESPDLKEFGPWLGRDDLPDQPLRLQGSLAIDGPGLTFELGDARLGDVRLQANGRIADRAQPLGIDADFDLGLPTTALLDPWLSSLHLPEGPLTAVGSLRNLADRTRLEPTEIQLGELRVQAKGEITRERRFDFELDLSGPDASMLSAAARVELPPEAFQVLGRLSGDPDRLTIGAAEARVGEVELQADGEIRMQGGYTLEVRGSGPDASRLSAITRTELPPEAFSVAGRVKGEAGRLDVAGLDLTLGDSRVEGDIFLEFGEPKRLRGTLHAALLDLTPWLTNDEPKEATAPAKGRYVFDDTPVLRIADYGWEIQGNLTADTVQLNEARATGATVGLALNGERLTVEPFSATSAVGGRFDGRLTLTAGDALPSLEFDIDARNILMPVGAYEGQDVATLPRGDITMTLRGQGSTRRAMAQSLDGRLRVNFGAGELARSGFDLLVNDFVTELFSRLNPFTKTDPVTHLECLVAAADITDGVVDLQPVVINVRQLTIFSQGTIDLHTEKLNLTFDSRQRKGLGISASDLVNPFIKVGGTLASPAMTLDPAGTVVKGGIAVATAGLSILAKSLADRYLSSKDPCGDALRELAKRDQAQP